MPILENACRGKYIVHPVPDIFYGTRFSRKKDRIA